MRDRFDFLTSPTEKYNIIFEFNYVACLLLYRNTLILKYIYIYIHVYVYTHRHTKTDTQREGEREKA